MLHRILKLFVKITSHFNSFIYYICLPPPLTSPFCSLTVYLAHNRTLISAFKWAKVVKNTNFSTVLYFHKWKCRLLWESTWAMCIREHAYTPGNQQKIKSRKEPLLYEGDSSVRCLSEIFTKSEFLFLNMRLAHQISHN